MIFTTSPVFATSIQEASFESRLNEAHLVVHGQVDQKQVKKVKTNHGRHVLHTFVDLEVIEVLKGDWKKDFLTARLLGGKKGGQSLQIAGTPEFSLGEKVVLLLGKENRDQTFPLEGLSMAKYKVKKNREGDLKLEGLGLAPRHLQRKNKNPKNIKSPSWSIRDIKKHVKTAKNKLETDSTDRSIASKPSSSQTVTLSQNKSDPRPNQSHSYQVREPQSVDENHSFSWNVGIVVCSFIGLLFLGFIFSKMMRSKR